MEPDEEIAVLQRQITYLQEVGTGQALQIREQDKAYFDLQVTAMALFDLLDGFPSRLHPAQRRTILKRIIPVGEVIQDDIDWAIERLRSEVKRVALIKAVTTTVALTHHDLLTEPIKEPTMNTEKSPTGRVYENDPCESLSHFIGIMGRKLALNSHKPGWKGQTPYALILRLKKQLFELEMAIAQGQPGHAIQAEAADVANFAMMVSDLYWKDHP